MMKHIFWAALLLFVTQVTQANNVDERDPLTIIEETSSNMLQTLDERRAEFETDPQKLRAIVREDLLSLLVDDPRLFHALQLRLEAPGHLDAGYDADDAAVGV